jgi:tetratricopeptide (TPR) repeat protein
VSGDRYRGFVFVPADLAEDVDLTAEEKKEIIYLHENLGRLTYWQLLGVPWNAPPEAAMDAYRRQALLLHPDRHRGKRLGRFAARLAAVFPKLNEAREVLADPAKRAAYARATASPDDLARMRVREMEDERRSEERRARLNRQNPLVARAGKVSDLMARGRAEMEEGRWQQAANDFLTVASMDPRNLEAKKLAEEARRKAGAARAAEVYEKGLTHELAGQAQAALQAFHRALEDDPGNARYAVAASRAARACGDAAAARELAEQAVHLAPRQAACHEALAQALAAQGDAREARRAAEKALEIDPTLEGAKAVLKRRWGIFG